MFRFPIGVGNDDVEIEGSLRFSLNGNSSVLPMANDATTVRIFTRCFASLIGSTLASI